MSLHLARIPLILAPALLLLGAIACAALQRIADPNRRAFTLRLVSVVSAAFGALAVGANAPPVFSGGVVVSPGVPLFRIGSLDANLGFVAESRTLLASAVVFALAIVASVELTREQRSGVHLPATLLAAAGGACAALADGFPALFLGLGVALWAARFRTEGATKSSSAWLVGFAGALVCAVATSGILFWSLGGRWLDDSKYLSDYQLRFAAPAEDTGSSVKPAGPNTTMPTGPRAAPKNDLLGQGSLTIVTHPGARVYLGVADEAQLERSTPFAKTPFVRKPIPAGLQKIVIAPGAGAIVAGDGLEVGLVDIVNIKADQETVISLLGPSLTFLEIDPQLTDVAALGARRMGPLRVATVLSAAWALAWVGFVLALRDALSKGRSGASFAVGCAVVALAMLAARFGAVVALQPWITALGAVAAAGVAVHAALRSGCVVAPAVMVLLGAAAAITPMAALVAAVALAPGLAALGSLGADDTPKPKQRAKQKTSTKASKKKGSAAAEEPKAAPEPPAPVWTSGAVTGAAAAVPLPVLGPFVGFATIAAAPMFSGFAGAIVALAAASGWCALGWAVGRRHAGQRAPRPTLTVMLAGVAALLAPAIGLWLKPWVVGREGSMVVVVVGLIPAALAVALYTRARSRDPEVVTQALDGEAPPALLATVRRAVIALDTLASLPLSWADLVFAPRASVASSTRAPASQEDADEEEKSS